MRAGLGTGRSAAATQKRYYVHLKFQEEEEEEVHQRVEQVVEQVVKALRDNPVRRTTQASPPDSAD